MTICGEGSEDADAQGVDGAGVAFEAMTSPDFSGFSRSMEISSSKSDTDADEADAHLFFFVSTSNSGEVNSLFLLAVTAVDIGVPSLLITFANFCTSTVSAKNFARGRLPVEYLIPLFTHYKSMAIV